MTTPTIELVYDKTKGLTALVVVDEGAFELPFRRTPYVNLDDLIERLFRDYATGRVEQGPDGLPTAAQQRHWLRHLIVPSQGDCSVCQREREEEARATRRENALRGRGRYAPGAGVSSGGKVIVRMLRAKGKASAGKANSGRTVFPDLGF